MASGGGGHNSAPRPGTASALPFNLIDVSAVPGTRQAWVLAGRYGGPFGVGNYLLHVGGQNWTRVATFGRDVHLKGVSAVSIHSAWVWGDEGGPGWLPLRPFLALVSGGVIGRVRAGLLSGVYVSAMAGHGTADTWLAGGARDRQGHFRGEVLARWDGTSWHRVPVPAGARAVWSLSISGPSDAWALVSPGFLVDQYLAHWNGLAWSRAYTPPTSLARDGRVPQDMSAASSPGHAWVAYTEAGTNSGSNEHNPPPMTISAYLDGSTWRTVPVPAAEGVAGVTMSGADAWAISALKNINGILYSHLGSPWRIQPLPHERSACMPTSVSAASPTYVIAVTAFSSLPCRRSAAYVYDGHRWRTLTLHPAG